MGQQFESNQGDKGMKMVFSDDLMTALANWQKGGEKISRSARDSRLDY